MLEMASTIPSGMALISPLSTRASMSALNSLYIFIYKKSLPFSMTLPKQEYRAERAIRAVQSLSEAAQQNGTADMSLDEINAEIAASRADRASRNARNGA